MHRLSHGFPQESLEYIGDGVVSQSGTAIERELYVWSSRELVRFGVEDRHAALNILRQQSRNPHTGTHCSLNCCQAATLEGRAPTSSQLIESLHRPHPNLRGTLPPPTPPLAWMTEKHQRQYLAPSWIKRRGGHPDQRTHMMPAWGGTEGHRISQCQIQVACAECLAHRFAPRDHHIQLKFGMHLNEVSEGHLEPVRCNILDDADPPPLDSH